MSRIIVGPFNRVEGDLEVQLEMEGNQVASAFIKPTLFRGFETMLVGRNPNDTLIYAPRICGICSVSQSVAAAKSLSQIYGITPTDNGQKAINLMLANENAADLLTHFYLFFMPDFARETYRDTPWFNKVEERFKSVTGKAASKAVEARANWLKMMGVLAGHWPHTLAIQPGGTSRAISENETTKLHLMARKLRRFLEEHLIGDKLETFLNLENEGDFNQWLNNKNVAQSDFGLFCEVAKYLNLETLGKSPGRLMSYGSFSHEEHLSFLPGLYIDGKISDINPSAITEDISHSHYQGAPSASPWNSTTQPDIDKPNTYSWCKAPRLDQKVIEVGSLARQVVNKTPLIDDLMKQYGSTVYTRIVARVYELVKIITLAESWLDTGFTNEKAFCLQPQGIQSNRGIGLVEAARGSLGHWLELENDVIKNFQVIAPTTWNFSPRDQNGIPGPLEQALVGALKRQDETSPVSVQHIVRSFDPCMVCTVH
ncbi:Ni,Fe-hydrogenase I large subunit [Hydrogenovibrio crunogenus]|uniref:Ni,Fe-hydrogenase I large subunit n=1 Tax=Hydrogenovibrio crunogenus TaxID=39765 RepID=A0A4P7P0L9_9GAMM|nr:nickel-dependent hydrogenase large subunit [Hydrogenovibrio crunogenus]QBZ82782.1 Ni,Fe-hydrogenase I large subunit [Hydrogenovibrio crunogenus]